VHSNPEETTLANSKSALKRWRQSLARRDRNRSIKSRTRTALGKALAAIQDDASTAEEAVRNAVSALDRAAQAGVIHANAAARGKSRLLKRFNLATANLVMAEAAAAPEQPAEKPKATRTRKAPASGTSTTRTRGRTTKK
jgi:small subunit ribosomal protein S20